MRERVLNPLSDASARILVTGGALLAALVAATLLARDPLLGITFVGGLVFVPFAFRLPQLALAAWMVTAFLSDLPGIGSAANRTLYILLVVWLGMLAAGYVGARADEGIRRRRLGTIVVLFVAWTLLSLLWAPEPDAVVDVVTQVVFSMLIFFMITTFVTEPAHARLLAAAFVTGAVLSILSGVVMGGLHPASNSLTADEGRLRGGTSDPNYLAAAIVPAIMLAAGLAARGSTRLMRIGLGLAVVILAMGLAATESRGGLLAGVVVAVAGLLFWKGRRMAIASMIVVVLVGLAMWFAAISPASWQRITANQDGGSGRTDIWTVAWRVVGDHPIAGVGLGQFPVVSPQYLDRPGALSRADLIIDQRIRVHNLYLELWAETGLVGLLLFLAVGAGAIAAARAGAATFDAIGDADMATLARAAMLAVAGALAASFFLSNVGDRRQWALMALCVALYAIARRERLAAAQA